MTRRKQSRPQRTNNLQNFMSIQSSGPEGDKKIEESMSSVSSGKETEAELSDSGEPDAMDVKQESSTDYCNTLLTEDTGQLECAMDVDAKVKKETNDLDYPADSNDAMKSATQENGLPLPPPPLLSISNLVSSSSSSANSQRIPAKKVEKNSDDVHAKDSDSFTRETIHQRNSDPIVNPASNAPSAQAELGEENFVRKLESFVASMDKRSRTSLNGVIKEKKPTGIIHGAPAYVPSRFRPDLDKPIMSISSADAKYSVNSRFGIPSSGFVMQSPPVPLATSGSVDQPLDLSVKLRCSASSSKQEKGRCSSSNPYLTPSPVDASPTTKTVPVLPDGLGGSFSLASLEKKFGENSFILDRIGAWPRGYWCCGGLSLPLGGASLFGSALHDSVAVPTSVSSGNLRTTRPTPDITFIRFPPHLVQDYAKTKETGPDSKLDSSSRSPDVSSDGPVPANRKTLQDPYNNNSVFSKRSNCTNLVCSCGAEYETLFQLTLHAQQSGHHPTGRPETSGSASEPAKLVRGQDIWLSRGSEQTRRILRCMECSRSFKSLPELTVHMIQTEHYTNIIRPETVHPIQLPAKVSPPAAAGDEDKSDQFRCRVCRKQFQDADLLGMHIVQYEHYRKSDGKVDSSNLISPASAGSCGSSGRSGIHSGESKGTTPSPNSFTGSDDRSNRKRRVSSSSSASVLSVELVSNKRQKQSRTSPTSHVKSFHRRAAEQFENFSKWAAPFYTMAGLHGGPAFTNERKSNSNRQSDGMNDTKKELKRREPVQPSEDPARSPRDQTRPLSLVSPPAADSSSESALKAMQNFINRSFTDVGNGGSSRKAESKASSTKFNPIPTTSGGLINTFHPYMPSWISMEALNAATSKMFNFSTSDKSSNNLFLSSFPRIVPSMTPQTRMADKTLGLPNHHPNSLKGDTSGKKRKNKPEAHSPSESWNKLVSPPLQNHSRKSGENPDGVERSQYIQSAKEGIDHAKKKLLNYENNRFAYGSEIVSCRSANTPSPPDICGERKSTMEIDDRVREDAKSSRSSSTDSGTRVSAGNKGQSPSGTVSALDSLCGMVYGNPVGTERPSFVSQMPDLVNGGARTPNRNQFESAARSNCPSDSAKKSPAISAAANTGGSTGAVPTIAVDPSMPSLSAIDPASKVDRLSEYRCDVCKCVFASRSAYKYHRCEALDSTKRRCAATESSPYSRHDLATKFSKYYQMAHELSSKTN